MSRGSHGAEDVFGWIVGIIGLVIAGMFSLGGFGTVTSGDATLFCGALALLFVAALLAIAARNTSQF